VGATNADIVRTARIADSPVSLFLMINTFETGGSERQFSVLAENVSPSAFQLHLGCVNRRGPLADLDRRLRAADPRLGVRDANALERAAAAHGLAPVERVPMPGGDLLVVLRRGG